jgi:Transglycosylase-like domain
MTRAECVAALCLASFIIAVTPTPAASDITPKDFAPDVTPAPELDYHIATILTVERIEHERAEAERITTEQAEAERARSSPRPAVYANTDVGAHLARIRACESGGNYAAVSPDGRYRGAYQFDTATWQAMGGTGDPAQASMAEQDARAAALYAQSGGAPWPVCQYR